VIIQWNHTSAKGLKNKNFDCKSKVWMQMSQTNQVYILPATFSIVYICVVLLKLYFTNGIVILWLYMTFVWYVLPEDGRTMELSLYLNKCNKLEINILHIKKKYVITKLRTKMVW